MKTIKNTLFAVFCGAVLLSTSLNAQEEKTYFVTATTLHWNMNQEDFSMDEWKATEKEYLDKVIKKNPLIIAQEVLLHFFTPDNTELVLVTTYENWDAIEKASAKDEELIKAAWPDEKTRNKFFEKKGDYYANNHSDEIYETFHGAKVPKSKFDKPMLYYVRKSELAYPKNGTVKEFTTEHDVYLNAVTYKNDFVKAYYPFIHAWGANKTDFTEVFVTENFADIEKALDKNGELFKATWDTEAKRKEYDAKNDKYFTGVHRDYIYKSVPELSK